MLPFAPVAQLDRVPDYESGGRTFESYRARQISKEYKKSLIQRMGLFCIRWGSGRGDVSARSTALGKIQLNAQANWVVYEKLRHIEPRYHLFLINLTKFNQPRLYGH